MKIKHFSQLKLNIILGTSFEKCQKIRKSIVENLQIFGFVAVQRFLNIVDLGKRLKMRLLSLS